MPELPTSERAVIEVDIDLQSVIAKVQRSGDITKKEARDIERELKRAYKDAAKASEDAARQAARAHSQAARDALREQRRLSREMERQFAEQAGAVRGLFSAAIGGVGGDLLDLKDSLGGVSLGLGAVGAALGALAVGPVVLGGTIAAVRDLADAAVEARRDLEDQGYAVEKMVSATALENLTAYEQATAELAVSAKIATVEIGGALAPALTRVADALVDFTPAARVAAGAIDRLFQASEAAQPVMRAMVGVMSGGTSELVSYGLKASAASVAVDELAEATDDLAAAQADVRREIALTADDFEVYGPSVELSEEAARKQAEAAEEAARAQREHAAAAEEAARKQREYEEAVKAASEAIANQGETINYGLTEKEAQRVNAAAAENSAAIADMGADEEDEGPLAQLSEQLRDAADAATHLASAFSPILGNLATLQRIEQQQHEERVRQLQDQRAASREVYRDALAEYEASREGMTEAERVATEDYLARLKQSETAKREQVREIEKEEKRAAKQAFKRQQDLQIAQATIDAARNAVVLAGSLSYLGFGAIPTAIGLAAGQLKTQLAIIKSQDPPKFHFGTPAAAGGRGPLDIPGRTFGATLEQGEGVVNRRGMASPGARDIVEALNRGLQPLASPAVHIGDAQADALTARQNRPYAPAIRGRAMAGTNTFFRGR